MPPRLSIMICSLHARSEMLLALLAVLEPQITDAVELLIDLDRGEATIGAKRNRLLERAAGDYVCFVDDDDQVTEDYVALILQALDHKPDCVGFVLMYYEDGRLKGRAVHSLRYQRYADRRLPGKGMYYERTPNHLNPIRREIALQVRFPESNRGEDTSFAQRIRPLLKSESFIDCPLYRYYYRRKK